MPEEQAFSVMVKILYNYKHRDLFKANFQNLHLMFYQLDKLLEVSRCIKRVCLCCQMTNHAVRVTVVLRYFRYRIEQLNVDSLKPLTSPLK